MAPSQYLLSFSPFQHFVIKMSGLRRAGKHSSVGTHNVNSAFCFRCLAEKTLLPTMSKAGGWAGWGALAGCREVRGQREFRAAFLRLPPACHLLSTTLLGTALYSGEPSTLSNKQGCLCLEVRERVGAEKCVPSEQSGAERSRDFYYPGLRCCLLLGATVRSEDRRKEEYAQAAKRGIGMQDAFLPSC